MPGFGFLQVSAYFGLTLLWFDVAQYIKRRLPQRMEGAHRGPLIMLTAADGKRVNRIDGRPMIHAIGEWYDSWCVNERRGKSLEPS